MRQKYYFGVPLGQIKKKLHKKIIVTANPLLIYIGHWGKFDLELHTYIRLGILGRYCYLPDLLPNTNDIQQCIQLSLLGVQLLQPL